MKLALMSPRRSMSKFEVLVRQCAVWMFVAFLSMSIAPTCGAQASSATLSLSIADTTGAVISDSNVTIRNLDTNQEQQSKSGRTGEVNFSFLKPGRYGLLVTKNGFADVSVDNINLNISDVKQLRVVLKVGSTGETVNVDGSGLTINTNDGSVSTVIDRQFVANMPLNGRSFQDLISMTPGVVTATPQTSSTSSGSNGEFSINGQRTEDNYYIVDGVAANVSAGSGQTPGSGTAGVIAATSALGTTQSLLSVDDLQEFRVESSSYSAEFGRSPGGQLTFVTRSGTNAYHGSAYDYFRNGWFDANDWFTDRAGQPKKELHQNDFGGTFGGPLWIPRLLNGTNQTFFFGSYEGLRVVQPIAATVQYVPDSYMRDQAPAAMQPLLNAFPQQTPHAIDYGTAASPSLAQYFQGYSVPGTINSSSVRIDQTFTPVFSAFFRFADTPSSLNSRNASVLTSTHMDVQTYTLGTTWLMSSASTNQFRLGYSRSYSGSSSTMDSFGGAVPIDLGKTLGNTTQVTGQNLEAEVVIEVAGAGVAVLTTPGGFESQHQWNMTDTFDITHGAQHWKLGVDYRQIASNDNRPSVFAGDFLSAQSVLTNSATEAEYEKFLSIRPVYNQIAIFVQNDWRLSRRLSLSAGLRWELAPPPHNDSSPQPYTLAGNLNEPSTLSLAPAGTPMWHNAWYNFAPRLGLAWQGNSSRDWATVVRLGGGVFFDTNNWIANAGFGSLGFKAQTILSNVPFPLTPSQQNLSFAVTPPYTVQAYPSHLQLPYTLQWNTSLEQALGQNNSVTISYIGAAGRRLSGAQELSLAKLNPLFSTVTYVVGVTSDYDALQAKFQRSVGKGLTTLVSYTWSHSIDQGSNAVASPVIRGNSDFDVRNNFQAGLTWSVPHLKTSSKLASKSINGWGFDARLLARTSFPVPLNGNLGLDPATGSYYYTSLDLVPREPIYLYGNQYPGGRSLNPAAFTPPIGTNPGNAPRNFARGFGESQVNFAARREFALSEKVHLQFRAEAFNVFNHPNFGYVDPTHTDATFGQATMTLNESLGTMASQYQQGGPRSMQFSLHCAF
jgi:hypothetical protein